MSNIYATLPGTQLDWGFEKDGIPAIEQVCTPQRDYPHDLFYGLRADETARSERDRYILGLDTEGLTPRQMVLNFLDWEIRQIHDVFYDSQEGQTSDDVKMIFVVQGDALDKMTRTISENGTIDPRFTAFLAEQCSRVLDTRFLVDQQVKDAFQAEAENIVLQSFRASLKK